MSDRRFYISHAPRFGSYANPIRSRVEQSPYYWWWYALTLNEDYRALCEAGPQRASTSSDRNDPLSLMLKVYEDFGDVRYEGDRYRAFSAWWRERVNTNEQRGAYLFAEPLRDRWTRVVSDKADANDVIEDNAQVLIALPIHQTRQAANKALKKIVAKHIAEQRGRAVTDPRSSQARYHLATALHIRGTKLAFDIWDHRNACAVDPIPKYVSEKRSTNVRIAQAVGLRYTHAVGDEQNQSDERRALSTQVSRYLRLANSMIESAGYGMFP